MHRRGWVQRATLLMASSIGIITSTAQAQSSDPAPSDDRMDADGNETGAAIGIVPVTGGAISHLRDFDTFAYYSDRSWATDTIVHSTEALTYKAAPRSRSSPTGPPPSPIRACSPRRRRPSPRTADGGPGVGRPCSHPPGSPAGPVDPHPPEGR